MRPGMGPAGSRVSDGRAPKRAKRARDPAQEAIVLGERVSPSTADSRPARPIAAMAWMVLARRMPGVSRAVHHHERLRDELDVDEASTAELDVQSPRSLLAELALHAQAQLAHLLQVGRRRLGPVEQVADHAAHRAPHARIAAHEAGARQRLPLPGIRPFPVVTADGVEVSRQSRCPSSRGAAADPRGRPRRLP